MRRTYRNYLMQTTYLLIDTRKPEHTDCTTYEWVQGKKIVYLFPWYTTFDPECEFSWWTPKPSDFNLKEMQQATMLEF